MEDFKPAPPLDSWEEINKQLDIDEVWENLHANLDQIDKNEQYFKYSKYAERIVIFAALLLLLLPAFKEDLTFKDTTFPAVEDEYSHLSDADGQYSTEEIAEAGQASENNDRVLDNPDDDQNTYNTAGDSDHSEAKRVTPIGKPKEKTRQISAQNGADLTPVQFENSSPQNLGKVRTTSNLEPLRSFGMELKYPQSSFLISGRIPRHNTEKSTPENNDDMRLGETNIPYTFAIGIYGAVKNRWLLNQATYKGLSSEELNTTLPSFGKNLGISAVYNVKQRVALQAELAYSEEGQSYKDYINGHYTKKSINLQYVNLSAILKYRLSPLVGFSKASNSSFLLGFYNSRLLSAEEKIRHKSQDVMAEYKPNDAGVLAGFEYEYSVSKSMVVTTGLRFKYGLTNIYSGKGRIPSSLSKTRNGSVDLNISLLFLIPNLDKPEVKIFPKGMALPPRRDGYATCKEK